MALVWTQVKTSTALV